MRIFVSILLLSGASVAANVPSGWKVVKSPQRQTRTASPTDHGGGGSCQVAVPPDWVADTEADRTVGQTGHMKSPDGKLSVRRLHVAGLSDRAVRQTGHMKSPDGKLSVSIQEHPPGQPLDRAKAVAMQFDKRAKVLEESPNRVWLTSPYVLGTTWTVLVAGNPVCEAHFIIEDPSMQDLAKKVVATVGPAK